MLEPFPVSFTTWESWVATHPNTLALDVPARISGFNLDRMAIALELGGDAAAFRYEDVVEQGVINDVVGGLEVAIVVDPTDRNRWTTFARRLDDGVLTLAVEGDELVDAESGSVWDPVRGVAIDGPRRGETLGVLPGFTIFPRDFGTFWPDGRIWEQ